MGTSFYSGRALGRSACSGKVRKPDQNAVSRVEGSKGCREVLEDHSCGFLGCRATLDKRSWSASWLSNLWARHSSESGT